MVVATYYGGSLDNPEIDYTNWNEWISAIREDFRKFIDYRLNDIDNSKNLIKQLRNVSENLSNICPLGMSYLGNFNIDKGESYTIIEYPVYDGNLNRYNCAYAIIGRDYKKFIFVNSVNSAPLVTSYEISKTVKNEYSIPEIDLAWGEGTILETLCDKADEVKEEHFVPGIDLTWREDNIDENLKYLRGDVQSVLELGGFADSPKEVDGDYKAFNFCLACDFASSMHGEDFERLGYMDSSLFKTIASWLNYDGEIGKNIIDFIDDIPKGNFKTAFNRTFAEAVCARHIGDIAESLIYNGNKNPYLYFTAIAYSEPLDDILNRILGYLKDAKEYVEFVNELMSIINQEYIKKSEEERDIFINILKPYLRNMAVAKSSSFLTNTYNFEWFNEVFGIKGKERKLSDEKPNN